MNNDPLGSHVLLSSQGEARSGFGYRTSQEAIQVDLVRGPRAWIPQMMLAPAITAAIDRRPPAKLVNPIHGLNHYFELYVARINAAGWYPVERFPSGRRQQPRAGKGAGSVRYSSQRKCQIATSRQAVALPISTRVGGTAASKGRPRGNTNAGTQAPPTITSSSVAIIARPRVVDALRPSVASIRPKVALSRQKEMPTAMNPGQLPSMRTLNTSNAAR